MSRILAIVGMHRTGTSLLARYLQESGLFIGADLLGPHGSNPAGHYEDKDFLNLHNQILSIHGLDHKVTSAVNWNISEDILDKAKSLIAHRADFAQWGWKDPRTCLFLPMWKSLIPDLHFIITYRPYEPVIRSVLSRAIGMYKEQTSRLQRIQRRRFGQAELESLANLHLKVWIHYHENLLRFVIDAPSTSWILVPFSQLILGEFQMIYALRRKGFVLNPPANFNAELSKSTMRQDLLLTFNPDLEKDALDIDARMTTAMNAMTVF